MLDDLEYLGDLLKPNFGGTSEWVGEMYCARCGGTRRMNVGELFSGNHEYRNPAASSAEVFLLQRHPILLSYRCTQCDAQYVTLVYLGTTGHPAIAIFPEERGSLATPHTPESVAYYLNEVQSCWSVGANSAAMSMYRVALDHLLFEQGYTKGMVGAKLGALTKDVEAGTAPEWTKNLDSGYMDVLNKLATYALHPNDGNVSQQSVFDQKLLVAVKATFQALLFRVYELSHQEREQLNTLEAALTNLKVPQKGDS